VPDPNAYPGLWTGKGEESGYDVKFREEERA
jgi:hypothetical protein